MTHFDPSTLPVTQYKTEIIDSLHQHQVIIVAGETGSGKTTQLPKFCHEFLGNNKGIIGCTQPRRIAAISIADRLSDELDDTDNMVGYKIRFHDRTSKDTRIKFMTDGILLAETRTNKHLHGYKIIILDEAHERSLNIDFLLGYMKKLLHIRKDLKLVITSATIDTEIFSKHFNAAPVIDVEGRSYPVEVKYIPDSSDEETANYVEHCVNTIVSKRQTKNFGDSLVFLPTEKDIRQCCELLEAQLENTVILPMFSRLQSGEQKRIFASHPHPKIVVATNVAETSITVPGIRWVFDSGLARISRYNSRSKTTSLPVTRVSKASCDQRKGRCGRIGPGTCVRLFSEEDYLSRDTYTTPEIKRSNLASVILQMTNLNLGSPPEFPFVDAPLPSAIRDGKKVLFELDAITKSGKLTEDGRFMASLPIDPTISKIILTAQKYNCVREIKIIASVLAIQDPQVRPSEKEKEADLCHKKLSHPQSDFLTFLNLWEMLHENGKRKSWNQIRRFCKSNFYSFQRIREWLDLHEQLSRILNKEQNRFIENVEEGSYADIHKSLLSGFLRNCCKKEEKKIYQNCANNQLMIFPGSNQFKKGGKWIFSASFLETNRLYAVSVATIEPEWIEETGKRLCSYSWSNPRWNKKTGTVVADEKVSLWGLVLEAGRPVSFGKKKKQRDEARNIFIQHALIQRKIHERYSFLQHNTKLIQKWKDAEDTLRRKDILIDETALHDFYLQRLPHSVFHRASLNKFLKNRNNEKQLFLKEKDILTREVEGSEFNNYPKTVIIQSINIELAYTFDPGSGKDGITFKIPVNLYNHFSEDHFQWLVPGLLVQKIQHLVKGLPKSLRKKFVPVNQAVDRIHDDMQVGVGNFYSSMERSVFKLFGFTLSRQDLQQNLPPHLTPYFELIDDNGKVIQAGRSYSNLNPEEHASANSSGKPGAKDGQFIIKYNNSIHTECDFTEGLYPIFLYTKNGTIHSILYPSLQVEKDKQQVRVEFISDKNMAFSLNNSAMVYLYQRFYKDSFKSLKKYFKNGLTAPSVQAFFASSPKGEVFDNICFYIFSHLFHCNSGQIHTASRFKEEVSRIPRGDFYKICTKEFDSLCQLLKKRMECLAVIRKFNQLTHQPNNTNNVFLKRLNEILPEDFLSTFSFHDASNAVRMFSCLQIRRERAHNNPHKDLEKQQLVLKFSSLLSNIDISDKTYDDATQKLIRDFRVLLDEYRISVFAPELKTRKKVSAKIMDKAWKNLSFKI